MVLEGQFSGGSDDDCLALRGVVVDSLEGSNREGGSFSCARLGLGDDVVLVDDGEDALLLDDGGFFETEG